jgi:small subunit ribosomal protein S6
MILTPETVIELERTLKVSEIVLRYMLTKRDAKAVQKEREEREEREARAAAAAAAAAAKAEAESEVAQSVTSEEAPAEETLVITPGLSSEELDAAPAATDDSETVEV